MKVPKYFCKNISKLQDNILDRFNDKKISKKEMLNMMMWIENVIKTRNKR